MPMLSRILHPHQSRKRAEFISGSSLASAEAISNRIQGFSSGDRSRPIALRFYKEQDKEGEWSFKWRHPECAVMKWYDKQTESSTKFTTIEHRRELMAPFHHEYLLINLDDDTLCRLERMGEGSRADAIRRVGCTAHDIIQWFTKDTYTNHPLSKEASELVMHVKFPRSFDLLDVLAICFSVQKVKTSSAYTLQRYNCYFLCLTVLNVLVRRTAGWEYDITNDGWVEAVDNMIKEFKTMECKDEHEHLGIGLCAMVNPDMPEPRELILDPLREVLLETGYSSMSMGIGNTLWHEDLRTTSHNGLKEEIERTTKLALEGTDTRSLRMKQLLGKDASAGPADESAVKSSGASLPPKLQREIMLSMSGTLTSAWGAATKSAAVMYAMQEVEDPTPLYIRLISPFVVAWFSVALGSGSLKDQADLFGLKGANTITRIRAAKRLLPFTLQGVRWALIRDSDDPSLQEMAKYQEETLKHAAIIAFSGILRSALCEGLDKYLVLPLLDFSTVLWMQCLCVCVGKHLDKILMITEHCSSMGAVNVYTATDPTGSQMTVVKFQELIIKRIHNHANRVAAVGLAAAAPLVQSEIERTMAEVWKEMPGGENWEPPNGSNEET